MIPLTSVLHNTSICFQFYHFTSSLQYWTCLYQAVVQHEDYFYIEENSNKMNFFTIQIQKYFFVIVICHSFLGPLILQFISK